MERKINRWKYRLIDGKIDLQMERQMNRWKARDTYKQIDGKKDR